MSQDAPDRSKRVLAALVREYIASGEPVASSLLVTAAGLGVSSATVRNILARLEEEGFVQQPHTSAGRIPTDRGYRFYVDLLLDVEAAQPRRRPRSKRGCGARARTACSTRCCRRSRTCCRRRRARVGFAVRPAHEAAVFDRVEFVPLSAAARARRHRRQRRPRDPEGHRDRRAARAPTTCGRRRTTSTRSSPACRCTARARRCSSGSARSARSTTRCCARALRLATSTFADLPDDRADVRRGRVVAARRRDRADACRRCRRCCR